MILTALRILNLLIWVGLFVCVFSGARSAITGKDVHRGDPWRLSVAAVCVVIILGNLRWLLAPNNAALFASVYALTGIVGIYKIILARVYGRGPRL